MPLSRRSDMIEPESQESPGDKVIFERFFIIIFKTRARQRISKGDPHKHLKQRCSH